MSIKRLSTDTGSFFKAAAAHRAARWQRHPRINNLGPWFLMNLAQNRVVFPNHNAGSVWGISYDTTPQYIMGLQLRVLSHHTVLLPYLHCRQALLGNALLADVTFHSNIAPWFQNTSCPFGHPWRPSHKSVKGEDWHSSTTSALSAGARAYLAMAAVFVLPEANPIAILLSGNISYLAKLSEMICYKEWQVVFSNEGCKVDFSCSDVFLYIPLETGSSDGRLAGHTTSKMLVFFWSYVMFNFMNPATCNREIRLENIATDKRGPLLLENTLYRFRSGCHLLNVLPV